MDCTDHFIYGMYFAPGLCGPCDFEMHLIYGECPRVGHQEICKYWFNPKPVSLTPNPKQLIFHVTRPPKSPQTTATQNLYHQATMAKNSNPEPNPNPDGRAESGRAGGTPQSQTWTYRDAACPGPRLGFGTGRSHRWCWRADVKTTLPSGQTPNP